MGLRNFIFLRVRGVLSHFCVLAYVFFAAANPASGQGFFQQLDRLLNPGKEPAPIVINGPERPVERDSNEQKGLVALPAMADRDTVQLLINAVESLSRPQESEARTESIRDLREFLLEEPDGFVWTSRKRWVSARRLARDTLNQFVSSDGVPPAVPPPLKKPTLQQVASQSLRVADDRIARRLTRAWASIRRDAGDTILADLRSPETSASYDNLFSPIDAKLETPVSLARWTRENTSHAWADAVESLYEQRIEARQSTLPAARAVATNDSLIWRTAYGLQSVSLSNGEVQWNVRLPDSFESITRAVVKRPTVESFGFGNWQSRSSGEQQYAHAVLVGGARAIPVVDDRQLYTVIDPTAFTAETLASGSRFRNSQNDELSRKLSSNLLRAVDHRTGHTRWEIGGPALQDQFERPFAGTFFLGPPTIVDRTLYAIIESRGEIQLLALDSRNARELWRQPLASTGQSIDQDMDRRFAAVSPVIQGGIAICPTTVGWTCGVDIDGHELLWASEVSKPSRVRSRYNDRSLGSVDSRWRNADPIIDGPRVWVFPPDFVDPYSPDVSRPVYCFDRVTGQALLRRDVDQMLAPVGIIPVSDRVRRFIGVQSTTVVAIDFDLAPSPTSNSGGWTVEIGPGRAISGRPVIAGDNVHVPVDGSELWTIDIADGAVKKRRPYTSKGDLGNLSLVDGSIVSCSPLALTVLLNQSDLAIPTSDAVEDRLQVARVTGDLKTGLGVLEQWASQPTENGPSGESVPKFLRDAVETVIIAADSGFRVSPAIVDLLDSMAATPEQELPLERFRILELIRDGDRVAAANRLIELAERDDLESTTIEAYDQTPGTANASRRVRFDRWVSSCVGRVWQEANKEERQSIGQSVDLSRLSETALLRLVAIDGVAQELVGRALRSRATEFARLTAARRISAGVSDRELRAAILQALGVDKAPGGANRSLQSRSWDDRVFQVDVLGMYGTRPDNVVVPVLSDERIDRFTDKTVRVSRSWNAVRIEDSTTNQLIASLPLAPSTRRSYSGETLAWCDHDQLFLASRRSLHVWNLDDYSAAWDREVESEDVFYRTTHDAAGRLDLPRNLLDQAEIRDSAIAAFGPDAVVFRERFSLVAVSRKDGAELWRRDANPNDFILGDVHEGLVIRSENEWRLIRFSDGEAVPISIDCHPRRFVAANDDGLVTIQPEGYTGPVEMTRWELTFEVDGVSARPEWQLKIERDSKAALLPPRQVAVIDSERRLSLIDLTTGEQTTPTAVADPEMTPPKVDHMAIVALDGQLLVMSDAQFMDSRPFGLEHNSSRAVVGILASFDLVTGRRDWVRDEQSGNLLWGASWGAPVLMFLKRKSQMIDIASITDFDVRLVSRQSGQDLVSFSRKLTDRHLRDVVYDSREDSLSIRLLQSRIRVEALSDQLPADE